MVSVATNKYLKFVEKVVLDRNLARQLAEIKPGDRAAILALASSQGYDFTPEELEEATFEAKMALDRGEGELSDAELEGVSGGLLVCIAIIAILIG